MLSGPETNNLTQKEMGHARRNGLPFNTEQVMYTKNGIRKQVKVEGQPMRDENGVLSMFFVIVTDITEQRRLEEERLQNQLSQQKEITRVMIQAQEAERSSLGIELHDNINQLLAATALQLSYSITHYRKAKPVLANCYENITMAIDEIRRLSHKMVMPRFSASSLACELTWLIAHYKHVLAIELDTKGWDETHMAPAIKETLFRIAQEQLYNIQKHAKAGRILLSIGTEGSTAQMSICDDGVGFDTTQEKKGIGITNIINRAEAYNGASQFISAPGKGCRLVVTIPFGDPAGAGYCPIR
jgi:two-component system sensor histidine kinase UhpB